jgi:hypothetical protein
VEGFREPLKIRDGEFLGIIGLTSLAKSKLDEIRRSVSFTIDYHHSLKSMGYSDLVDFAEDVLTPILNGRGENTGRLAGGVKFASSPEEAVEVASRLLSSEIRGVNVSAVLVEERICISRELYVSLTIDRATRKPVFLVSEMGGVEIEDLARRYPGKIKRIYIDPEVGYTSYMARIALTALNLPWSLIGDLDSLLKSMYRIMVEYDAELVEFNPLVLTCDGRLVAVDAKIIVDNNSLQRPPELQMRLLLGGLMIVLAIASFTTSRVSPFTALTIITGGLLIMISSIGFSILLAEFYKVFDSPTLWIASLKR